MPRLDGAAGRRRLAGATEGGVRYVKCTQAVTESAAEGLALDAAPL